MDMYGIGSAMKSMIQMYTISARGSGRTTEMINSLKDGDRVYFTESREAERVGRMCRERKLEITCVVIPVSNPGRIFEYPTSKGRSVFDHRWVEEYYSRSVERAEKDIEYFQRQSSGFGEAHEETKLKAKEISKWGMF